MNTLYKSIALLFILVSTTGNYIVAQVSTDSLLLYLPFDGNVDDASDNSNNGIVFNAILDTNRLGDPNSSYRFNGVDSYIEIPASPSMNKIQTSDVVSISAWININAWHSSGNVFSIFERYNPTTDAGWLYEANWAGGGILWLADETNATNAAGCNFSWSFDQWYFVCLTYNQAADTAHFYVDGVHVCATPYAAPINVMDTTSSFVVGRSLAGPDEYSDGWIDELRVYNRVLTSAEVGNIFSSTKPVSQHNKVIVAPNPAKDFVEFHLSDSNHDTELTLIDMFGRTVVKKFLNGASTRVDVQNLIPGIYLYRLTNSNGLVTGRLLVQ